MAVLSFYTDAGSLCLEGKPFTDGVISQAPEMFCYMSRTLFLWQVNSSSMRMCDVCPPYTEFHSLVRREVKVQSSLSMICCMCLLTDSEETCMCSV